MTTVQALSSGITAEQIATFEEMVKTHERVLYLFALRLCGDQYEAQDLLQEALFRAYKSLSRFEPGTAFDRWLYQIIHNLYIDHYRKKKRRPFVASLDEPQPNLETEKPIEIPDWTDNPEREAMRSELETRIQAGLNELSPEYRTAVVLCDVQGLSYEEISDITNCSIGTVRSRIHRGRKALRQILQPYIRETEESEI